LAALRFQNTLSLRLAAAGLPAYIAIDAESYVAVLKAMPKSSIMREQAVRAYAEAFKVVWEVMKATAALGLVLSLGIAHYSLDQKYESRHQLSRKEQTDVEIRNLWEINSASKNDSRGIAAGSGSGALALVLAKVSAHLF
jgi:hypothetical protein